MKKRNVMIFAGVLIIAAVLVLILVISGDMKSAKMYQNAKRSRGRVAGRREDYTIAAYGSGPAGVKRRRYYQYEVEFEAEGRKHSGYHHNLIGSFILLIPYFNRIPCL